MDGADEQRDACGEKPSVTHTRKMEKRTVTRLQDCEKEDCPPSIYVDAVVGELALLPR